MMDNFTNCTVGIVGGNAVAEAIALRMVAVGIDVVLHDHGALEVPSRRGERPRLLGRGGSLAEVVEQEIVVLAVPWSDLPNLLTGVRDWESRILIDATNPPLGNGLDAAIQADLGSSYVVAAMSVGAEVVKCFNTLPADLLARNPTEHDARRVLFVCGDHPRAKRVVCEMIDVIGFAAIDLGGLVEGGRLQGLPGGQLANRNLLLAPT